MAKLDYRDFKLNRKQAKVVELIEAKGMDQAEAYMKVYKTKQGNSTRAAVSRLLAKPHVEKYRAAINEKASEVMVNEAVITKERLLEEETCLAFLDVADFVDEDGLY